MRRLVLIGSLVLNALLLGFILGDLARPIRAAQSLSELASHYPDDIRRDIRANVIAERTELQRGLAAFNATRAELFAAMRAPEFDRDRIEALMAEVRAHTTSVQQNLQAATLEAVAGASPEVRAEIKTPVLGERFLGWRDR